MTNPGREGDAFIEVHADTKGVEGEMRRGVQRAADDVERKDMPEIGDDFGDEIASSMGRRLEREAPTIGRRLSVALRRLRPRPKIPVETDIDGDHIKRAISSAMDNALRGSEGGTGIFAKLSSGIADAVGAGFNVSGRSPLIALLIPLLLVILALILAAVQAAGALVAILAVLPGILSALVLDIGVIVLAFQGMGTAIQGAFAAKNAKELKEAIKDLTPAAQRFVKELLPLKGFFKDLQRTAQESFFSQIVGRIPVLREFLAPSVLAGVQHVATALGKFVHDLLTLLASPGFVKFFDGIAAAAAHFVDFSGEGFLRFLNGVINLGNSAMNFMNQFGDRIGGMFAKMGDFFDKLANDPDFQKFLDDMLDTFDLVVTLLRAAIVFVGVFMDTLNKAGGAKIIESFTNAFNVLSAFLMSEAGMKAMEGLVSLSLIAINSFTGLILLILIIIGFLHDLFGFLTGTIIPAIGDFFAWIIRVLSGIKINVPAIFATIVNAALGFLGWLNTLDDKVLGFFGDLARNLFTSGKNLISNLINGAKAMLPSFEGFLHFLAQKVKDIWPFSPAKEGPLSGSGDLKIAGQNIVGRLVEGMQLGMPTLQSQANQMASTVTFGTNAINMNFNGALPSSTQAQMAGVSVGRGILSQLQVRDTRLAVRTM